MMNGAMPTEELWVVILLFAILAIFGLFFIVRGLKMPSNFEKNMATRKELKKKLEAFEEKNKEPSEEP